MIPPVIEDNHYLRRRYVIEATGTDGLRALADALDAEPDPPTFEGYTYQPWRAVVTAPYYGKDGTIGTMVEWFSTGTPNPPATALTDPCPSCGHDRGLHMTHGCNVCRCALVSTAAGLVLTRTDAGAL